MHEAARVQRGQALEHVADQASGALGRQRPALLDQLLEGPPDHVAHDG
jgi:hypothetical protein